QRRRAAVRGDRPGAGAPARQLPSGVHPSGPDPVGRAAGPGGQARTRGGSPVRSGPGRAGRARSGGRPSAASRGHVGARSASFLQQRACLNAPSPRRWQPAPRSAYLAPGSPVRGLPPNPLAHQERRVSPLRRSLSAGLLGLTVSGCQAPLDSFAPVTTQGQSIVGLFTLALAISALIFLLVIVVLTVVLVRFRARPGDEEPPQVEGNQRLEIGWTAAPALILAVMFVLTLRTMTIVTANELHLPAGTPAQLELTGADVIHSFWVPQFGWKRDTIPGKINLLPVQIDQPGIYDGACTEYCGTQHAWMRIRVVGQSPSDFDAWVQQQRTPALPPSGDLASRGQSLYLSNTCVNCHTIQGTPSNGRVGPDLTHVGSRSLIGSGVLANTPDNLARWIHNPHDIKPGVLMPDYRTLSNDDVRALAAYLEGLK